MAGSPPRHAALADARHRTDGLFALVSPAALFSRPVPERHRLNFYIGHLEAFDWNMICGHGLGLEPVHAGFNELFAFGIDPDSSDLPRDRPTDWPSLEETARYCRQVRRAVDAALDAVPGDVVQTCIEHRLMHAETLCYLLHNLDSEHKMGAAGAAAGLSPSSSETAEPAWVEIPPGRAVLGRRRGTGFGWDNEFEERSVPVPAFAVGKRKVSNGEYLRYVEQGGAAPRFWRRGAQGWLLRTMFGELPLPLDWPVYATHVQASAYAAHVGASLPTEAQWDRAAYGARSGPRRAYPWGDGPPGPHRGNFDFHRWDPWPVDAAPAGDSAFGVSQMVGNGWEWTADLLRPFPGFREYPFYPGYSSAFFDDQHYVLKGGSPCTARPLLRRTFRNWFRPGYPYVFSAFRLVQG